jgi:hypothetical protein
MKEANMDNETDDNQMLAIVSAFKNADFDLKVWLIQSVNLSIKRISNIVYQQKSSIGDKFHENKNWQVTISQYLAGQGVQRACKTRYRGIWITDLLAGEVAPTKIKTSLSTVFRDLMSG